MGVWVLGWFGRGGRGVQGGVGRFTVVCGERGGRGLGWCGLVHKVVQGCSGLFRVVQGKEQYLAFWKVQRSGRRELPKGQHVTRGETRVVCSKEKPQKANMSQGVKPDLVKITALVEE